MNQSLLAMTCAVLFAGSAIAQVGAPPTVAPKGPSANMADRPMAGMRMEDKSMAQMQEHMKKMQDHMTRMQKTTDQAERRKLMDEHMKEMQDGMGLMRSMGGGMMDGAGKAGSGAGQGAGPGTGTGTGSGPGPGAGSGPMGVAKGGRVSPQGMEQRMDMMQMLMEQLMKHQQMQAPAK